jgi:hypothetical protein
MLSLHFLGLSGFEFSEGHWIRELPFIAPAEA